jgi:hypothetical protein
MSRRKPPAAGATRRTAAGDYRYDDLKRHEEPLSATNPAPGTGAADALDAHTGVVPNAGRNLPNRGLTPDEAMNQDQQSRTNEDPKADRM